MRSSYGALEPVRVSLGVTREASRRRWGTVRLTGALAAAAVVVLVALAGPLSFRSSLLDAVSAIGNDAPSSIATYQPTITGIPYGYDPVSGGPLSCLSSFSLSLTCSRSSRKRHDRSHHFPRRRRDAVHAHPGSVCDWRDAPANRWSNDVSSTWNGLSWQCIPDANKWRTSSAQHLPAIPIRPVALWEYKSDCAIPAVCDGTADAVRHAAARAANDSYDNQQSGSRDCDNAAAARLGQFPSRNARPRRRTFRIHREHGCSVQLIRVERKARRNVHPSSQLHFHSVLSLPPLLVC